MVSVGVHGAADAIDELQRVHGLAINEALQVDMIETVLSLQTVSHALCDGLDNDDRSIEIGALVHLPHNPIDECAKKVAFAKLYDALGALRLCGGTCIKGLHNYFSLFRHVDISKYRLKLNQNSKHFAWGGIPVGHSLCGGLGGYDAGNQSVGGAFAATQVADDGAEIVG